MNAIASETMPGAAPPAAAGVSAPVEPPAVDVDKALPKPDAATRLAESRARLRAAMTVPPAPARSARAARPGRMATSALLDRGLGLLRGLSSKVRAVPAADVLIDAVETWWAAHPLHTAGAMAAEASKVYVQPIARRNPLALVSGAAVFGALFFLTRPWRWALRPVLLAGLLPQIVSQALRRAPVGTWVHLARAFARRQSTAPVRRPRDSDTFRTSRPAGAGSPSVPTYPPASARD
jgi:hypothetical protein